MTIDISIVCVVAYGEQVMLNIPIKTDDQTYKTASLGMSTHDGRTWTYHIEGVDKRETSHIDYYFSVSSAGTLKSCEWRVSMHRLDLNLVRGEHVEVMARWRSEPVGYAHLYTSAYTNCIEPRTKTQLARSVFSKTLRIVVSAPQVKSGEHLSLVLADVHTVPTITGTSLEALCAMPCEATDVDKPRLLPMMEHSVCEWQVDLNASTITSSLVCRLVAVAADGSCIWEQSTWRTFDVPIIEPSHVVVAELEPATFDRTEEPLCGESVSMSHLRLAGSCGIADFGTIAQYATTLRSRGLNALHLPPFNDTIATHTTADANPYSAVSVFALHPILVDVRQLPTIDDVNERESLETQARAINDEARFSYDATLNLKLSWLRSAFSKDGDKVMHSAAFRHFFATNEWWLVPYAQYCYLRDAYGTPSFRSWPNHHEWTEAERGQLQNARTKAYKKLAFTYYTQFVLHSQLRHLHDIAVDMGIVLRGDLTANINPSGCDIWHVGSSIDSDEWWCHRLQSAQLYYDACHVPHSLLHRQEVVQSTRLLLEQ